MTKKFEVNAEMAEHLRDLMNNEDWPYFGAMAQLLMDQWKKRLLHFEDGATMEQIGMERIRWIATIEGVQSLFIEMNRQINDLKQKEKEEREERQNARR